jgi:hypothetical protein
LHDELEAVSDWPDHWLPLPVLTEKAIGGAVGFVLEFGDRQLGEIDIGGGNGLADGGGRDQDDLLTAALNKPFEFEGDRSALHSALRKALPYAYEFDAIVVEEFLDGGLIFSNLALAFGIGEHEPVNVGRDHLKPRGVAIQNHETGFVLI